MPPMYINIGAYVGDGTLVDSHALVGSCAQIGARVHLSAGAQIGGVIEPVGAMPVIVEDDVLVGGNTGIYEGAVVKRRAVIAAGTVLTGSTPVYDLPNGRIIKPEPGQPLVVPEGAVVVPGRAVGHRRRRQGLGPVAGHAGDRQVPRRQDRHAHGARAVDPVDVVGLARTLIDIESTTGQEGAGGAGAGRLPARARLLGARAAARRRPHQRHRRGRASRSWCSPRTSTACRRSSRAGSRTACCTAAAPATPRASWRRRWPRPSGCGPRARRASAWCSSPAKSGAATAPRRPTPSPRSRAI